MISATCHCGAVEIRIPRQPETLTNCNCSICRRYGTLWAYFDRDEVQVLSEPGATSAYAWGDRTIQFVATSAYAWGDRTIQFVRCKTCGCVTHWEPIDPDGGSRLGVNARNFEPSALGDVRIRRLDGAVSEKYLD